MISIFSYNVEYGREIDNVFSWLATHKQLPDIICIQEYPNPKLSSFKKMSKFVDYDFTFTKSFKIKGIQLGELTAYNTKLLKLIKRQRLVLGGEYFESVVKKLKPPKRSALLTEFIYQDQIITVVNAHLTPFSLNNKRRRQLRIVLKAVKNQSAIICGDFNYPSLLGREGLETFMSQENYHLAGEYLITHKYKKVIPQQLDYVFYRGFELNKIEVTQLPYSDHYPVWAVFK